MCVGGSIGAISRLEAPLLAMQFTIITVLCEREPSGISEWYFVKRIYEDASTSNLTLSAIEYTRFPIISSMRIRSFIPPPTYNEYMTTSKPPSLL